jgi:DtxR family Mn-dependent transcriptional regulator
MKFSKSTEDYLEAIYVIDKKKNVVKVSDIAAQLNISPPSVTGFTRKLREKGLLLCERYGPVKLTRKGREIGRKTYEKHNMLADFFMLLGVDEKTALHDACLAEHILSNKTLNKLRRFVKKGGRRKYGDFSG